MGSGSDVAMEASDMVRSIFLQVLNPGSLGILLEHRRLYRIWPTGLRQSQESHHLSFTCRNLLRAMANYVSGVLWSAATALFD